MASPRPRRRWGLLDTLGLVIIAGLFVVIYPRLVARTVKEKPSQVHISAAIDELYAALRRYRTHCGGPPVGGATGTTNCTVATGRSGPTRLPDVLTLPQTNAQGRGAGPFLPALPASPPEWAGAGDAYAYVTTVIEGQVGFVVCRDGPSPEAKAGVYYRCP